MKSPSPERTCPHPARREPGHLQALLRADPVLGVRPADGPRRAQGGPPARRLLVQVRRRGQPSGSAFSGTGGGPAGPDPGEQAARRREAVAERSWEGATNVTKDLLRHWHAQGPAAALFLLPARSRRDDDLSQRNSRLSGATASGASRAGTPSSPTPISISSGRWWTDRSSP